MTSIDPSLCLVCSTPVPWNQEDLEPTSSLEHIEHYRLSHQNTHYYGKCLYRYITPQGAGSGLTSHQALLIHLSRGSSQHCRALMTHTPLSAAISQPAKSATESESVLLSMADRCFCPRRVTFIPDRHCSLIAGIFVTDIPLQHILCDTVYEKSIYKSGAAFDLDHTRFEVYQNSTLWLPRTLNANPHYPQFSSFNDNPLLNRWSRFSHLPR